MPEGRKVPILSVEHLSLSRGGRQIHHDLSLSFAAGITVILGPNGVGKTTFIEGLLDPACLALGAIHLDDHAVKDPASVRSFYARVGHMSQQWKYFSSFSALESVEYAAWLKGIPSRKLRGAAMSALEWVQLSDQAKTKVRRLSGGMQQRVGLAEAFVNDPKIVLLDEPTVGLDPAQRAAFRRFLRDKSADRVILLSTHLTDDVEATANRVIVMTDSGIVFDGQPADLAAQARDTADGASQLEAGYLAVVGALDELKG